MTAETGSPTPQEQQGVSPAEQLASYNDALVQKCDELLVGDFADNAVVATPGASKRGEAQLRAISRITEPVDGRNGFKVHPAHPARKGGWYEVYPDTPPVWVSPGRVRDENVRVLVKDHYPQEGQHTEYGNRDMIGAFAGEVLNIMDGQTYDSRKHVIVGSRVMDKKRVRVMGARAANWFRHL